MTRALAMQSNGVSSVFEIVLCAQIGNKPGLNRSPSQSFLRQGAGSPAVDGKEASDPAKVIGCFLVRFADDRYVQATADCLSDLSSRYALVGDAVIGGSSTTFLIGWLSGSDEAGCFLSIQPGESM